MSRPLKFDPPWIEFFTSPCPWFANQLKSFPQFSRLPKELQLMIWERAILCRQLVSLSIPTTESILDSSDEPADIQLQYRRPGLLHACFDARTVGLKKFTPAFASYLPFPIRFDFDDDYLELDMHMVEWIACVHEESETAIALVEPPKVKNLAISHYRQFRGEDFVLICQYFTGLERLMLNEPEKDESKPTSGLPHMFQPYDANFIARHRWIDLRYPIMKRIRGVRPKLEKWRPPALLIGTDTQWSRYALIGVKTTFFDIPGQTLPASMRPSPRSPHLDLMDWQPTLNIPSLEFVPRLGISGGEMGIQINKPKVAAANVPDKKDHYRLLAWVFEDASLRFRVMDSHTSEDYEKWEWPGRRDGY